MSLKTLFIKLKLPSSLSLLRIVVSPPSVHVWRLIFRGQQEGELHLV